MEIDVRSWNMTSILSLSLITFEILCAYIDINFSLLIHVKIFMLDMVQLLKCKKDLATLIFSHSRLGVPGCFNSF